MAQALAVDANGRVLAVGTARQVTRFGGDEVDLRGRVVLPGFTDAHGHLRHLAQALQSVDLTDAVSADDAAQRVARFIDAHRPEGWITGRGWDQTRWPGGAFPSAAVLDRVVPRQPVALTRVDGHALWANRAALAAAGVDENTEDPPGGRILRDASGKPSGVLIDAATSLVSRRIPAPGPAVLDGALAAAAQRCAAAGLCGVHEMGMDGEAIASLRRLVDAGRLPLRIRVAINGAGSTWQAWRGRGPERRYRDRLSVTMLKLFADGALGSRGAALLAPYTDDPGNSGLELATRDEIERWTREAVRAGFQVCTHAIGDRANRNVLDAYERVLAEQPGDRRLRIEHAQVLAPDDVPRFRQLGVLPSMQPAHAISDGAWAEERLGPDRVRYAYAWRSLLDTGTVIAAGSDFPVEPPDPVAGIAAAVVRRVRATGRVWHPEQRMTRA
ncbi:MAG TPA: amidohydrolase, partial [Dehalococcoidia bacterium]|nr:amidohydrolase [Dehalococcoidia bacterium]